MNSKDPQSNFNNYQHLRTGFYLYTPRPGSFCLFVYLFYFLFGNHFKLTQKLHVGSASLVFKRAFQRMYLSAYKNCESREKPR